MPEGAIEWVCVYSWSLETGFLPTAEGVFAVVYPHKGFIPPLIIPQPSAAPQWSDTRALRLIQYTHGDDNNSLMNSFAGHGD